jgi:hypothetical protein
VVLALLAALAFALTAFLTVSVGSVSLELVAYERRERRWAATAARAAGVKATGARVRRARGRAAAARRQRALRASIAQGRVERVGGSRQWQWQVGAVVVVVAIAVLGVDARGAGVETR